MSTRANINLLGRDFKLQADGDPQYALGELFNAWDGNTDKLLLFAFENLSQGYFSHPFADYSYEFTIKYGTLTVTITGYNLDTVDWTTSCPSWIYKVVQNQTKPNSS